MDNPAPRRLTDYLQRHGLTIDTAELGCIFCKNQVSAYDLSEFIRKNLQLVWRGTRSAYAVCTDCLLSTARYEFSTFYQCSTPGENVEDLCGRRLCQVTVRCVRCLAELEFAEKLGAVIYELDYMLVRGQWRSYCRNCIRDCV